MSRYIATRAIRGANSLVTEAEIMLQRALVEHGADTKVAFPNTAYYLPLILGMTGMEVQTLGQLDAVLEASQKAASSHPVKPALDAVFGRDLGQRNGDAVSRRGDRGYSFCI